MGACGSSQTGDVRRAGAPSDRLTYDPTMHRLVASWFGTGLILGRVRGSDLGSGTVGAAFALVLALGLGEIGVVAQIVGAAVVTVASVISSAPFTGDLDRPSTKEGDPGWVVVDEAAGTLVATIGLGLGPALVAWVVFRIADIYKEWFPGVAAAERLHGAVGITADDVVAGLYGLAAGWLTQGILG